MAKLSKPDRDELSKTQFAFPKQRKEPLENASHVRNAAARFNQVEGVSEEDRREAWKRIEAAAKKFGVELSEKVEDALLRYVTGMRANTAANARQSFAR